VSEYSPRAYRQLLAALKDRETHFAGFGGESMTPTSVYLRHDVDFSLEFAVALAEINHDEGVSATFFVLLRSHAYNLASPRSGELLERLNALGQRLGFHYSHGRLADEDESLGRRVADDFGITADLVPALEPVWCVHTPSPTLLQRCLELQVPGLTNAHSAAFLRDVPYYSDANMRYSVPTWLSIASNLDGPAQLLFHPVYWIAAQPGVLANLAVAAASASREALREMELNYHWHARFNGSVPIAVSRLADSLSAEAQTRGDG
jgi:hypothetical protein